MAYAEYHARCWAEGKTPKEIQGEIRRCEVKALTHQFKWNEVGSAGATWARADTLREVLNGKG